MIDALVAVVMLAGVAGTIAGFAATILLSERWAAERRRRWDEMETWGRMDRQIGIALSDPPRLKSPRDMQAWQVGWMLGEDGRKGL